MPRPPLQVKRFYAIIPRSASTPDDLCQVVESAQDAAQNFVNDNDLICISVETTKLADVIACTVWYRADAPVTKSAATSSLASTAGTKKVKVLKAKKAAQLLAAADDSDNDVADDDAGTELQAMQKRKKALPPQYARSALRVGFKGLNTEEGDQVSIQLRCSVGEQHTLHKFTAKKDTLAALGYAQMEEGTLDLKDLVTLSMHFIVDDCHTPLAEVPAELSPEKLSTLFAGYGKAVARPGSAAAENGGTCTVM